MQLSMLRPLLLALAACGATPAPAPSPSAPDRSFTVRDVRVFDGMHTLERVNVVVRDGRITSVGTTPPPAELPTIDGAGRTLLPGLIDAHAHVGSEAGLRDALRFGVTTELDMMTRPAFAAAHAAQRDQHLRTALADLYSAGTPATSEGGLGTQFGYPVPTLDAAAQAQAFVDARLAEGSAYLKIMYEPDAGIFTSLSLPTVAALVTAAHARGVITAVHVSSVAGARGAVDAGADGLAHVPSNAALDAALVRDMAARHVFAASTLSITAVFDGHSLGPALARDPRIAPMLTAAQREQLVAPGPGPDYPMAPYLARFHLDTAIANVRRLHAGGVVILAGDDADTLGAHGATLHGELELLTRAGLSPAEALRAATRAPADAFHLDDRGRIAPGARADLVLVDGNPLVDITATRAIVRVFKNGYPVARAP